MPKKYNYHHYESEDLGEKGGEMDVMSNMSVAHKDCGNGYCACGETVEGCWWLRIYFPYKEACAQGLWERLLNG